MTPMATETLLTTSEACAYLRCSRRTLVRDIGRGLLSPVRMSARRNLYRLSDIERLVSQRRSSDAELVRSALAFLSERHAEEDRALCPNCSKRRVNRGASLCTPCTERREMELSHKRKWWNAHGSEIRASRREAAASG